MVEFLENRSSLELTAFALLVIYVIASQCFHHFVGRTLSISSYSTWNWVSRLRNRIHSVLFLGMNFNRKLLFEVAIAVVSSIYGMIRIIDAYLSGRGLPTDWPSLVFETGPLFLGLFLAVHSLTFYRKPTTYTAGKFCQALDKPFPNHVGFDSQFRTDGTPPLRIERNGKTEDIIFLDDDFSRHLLTANQRPMVPYSLSGSLRSAVGRIVAENQNVPFVDAVILHRNACDRNGTAFTNESKIRISDLARTPDGGYSATLEKTGYYLSQMTNKMFSRQLVDANRPDKVLVDFRKDITNIVRHDDGSFELLPLSQSDTLSNHMGGTLLSVSSDGYPLFCIQSDRSNESAGRIVPSGSGSLDYADIFRAGGFGRRTDDLVDIVRHGLARELLEETGAVLQHSFRRNDRSLIRRYARNVRIAGYYRTLDWCGLPIFVGFSRHFQTYGDIVRNFERRTCLTQGFEVDIWDYKKTSAYADLNPGPIRSAEDMVRFVDDFVMQAAARSEEDGKSRSVSTQVIILRDLLKKNELFRAHFDKALVADVHT